MQFFEKKIIFFLLFSLLQLYSWSQADTNKSEYFSATALQEDFTLLRDSLQKLHPSLYRYKRKNEIDHLFDGCYARINHPMTMIDFYLMTSFMISSVEDGHTSCRMPRSFMAPWVAERKFFPIDLTFINGKAYVPCEGTGLPVASEILSVDKIPMETLIKEFLRYLPSDGKIETQKYWEMSYGDDPFGYLYMLTHGERPQFNVTFKTEDEKVSNAVVKADFVRNIECYPEQKVQKPLLNLTFRPGNVACLTIKTFSAELLERDGIDFGPSLDSVFNIIQSRRPKSLIIDLRNNAGGRDMYGAALYAHLTNKPFRYYASLNSTTQVFTAAYHPNLSMQQPAANNFKGKTYFLINGESFSATAEFCAIARSNHRGLFIGEETGGGYYGNTSGPRTTIVLPNSHILVNIPLNKYQMAVRKAKYADRGVVPNYNIVPTIKDIFLKRDVQMEFAVQLAATRRTQQ